MQVGDPVQTPRGEAIVEAWTPFTSSVFGRIMTTIYVYVRYPDDTVRLYPIKELQPTGGTMTDERLATSDELDPDQPEQPAEPETEPETEPEADPPTEPAEPAADPAPVEGDQPA